MTFDIAAIDYAIIGVYFTAVLFIGFWVSRKTETGEDLFLAGRNLGWWAIGFSLFASNISSTTLIGLTGAAYKDGIAVSNYEWMAAIILVVFVFLFVPVYIKNRISTIPEFLELRYTRGARRYFSGLTITTNVFIDTAGGLYAGAIVVQKFFPSVDMYTACIVLALVAGLYTAAGGLAAVVYTDVIQAVVLLAGACVTTYLLFSHPAIDMSCSTVVANTDPAKLSLMRPLSDPNLPWLGTVIGVPILAFYFWCTNQFIVQRVLGAKSINHARWGSLLGGLLKLPVLFIMVLPGTMAAIIYPNIANGDDVFPTLIVSLLPVGIVGLVLAALIAAIMSSVDSTLNSASTLVTLDFVKPANPNITPKQVAKVGRISILVFMIVAALWAPQIAHFEGLFAYLQSVLAYIVPPVVVLFLPGLFWSRASRQAALPTLLGGHAISVAVFVGQKTELLPDIHFTIVAGILFALSLVIFVVASLLTEAPSKELVARFSDTSGGEPTAWWADHRLLSAILLALTAALVISFW
jgi:SSS family solute:Na+ symporter